MKKSEKGFGVVSVLLILMLIGLIGGVGYYIYSMQKDSTNSVSDQAAKESDDTKTNITFKDEAVFTSAVKQEILDKVVDPFVYYQDKILGSRLKDVVIDTAPNRMSDNDYLYRLTYHQSTNTQESGFLFAMNNKIGYWIPGLCDPGGCAPYPDDFKQRYPGNYQAYLDCEAATNANNKDRANLVCAP